MKINQDNMIITIDTELCANGEKIAKELADMLHLPCYGEEILDKASELSGIPARLMHCYDGRAVHAAYDLLANDHDPLHIRPAADFITAQVAACRELAAKGSYVHSDLSDRAARLAEQNGLSAAEAEKQLKRADRAYRSYYRGNHKGWGEADSYDISINASDGDVHTLACTLLSFLESMVGAQLADRKETKAV